MTMENQSEECFRKGFELVKSMPAGEAKSDLIDRVIEYCLRLKGIKEGVETHITILPKGKI